MPKGSLTVRQKIVADIISALEAKLSATVVVGDLFGKDNRYDSFPMVFIRAGAERASAHEHGKSVIVDMDLLIKIVVHDSENIVDAIEEQIQDVDNAIQADIHANNNAIAVFLDTIFEPEFEEFVCVCDITYKVRYQFTAGDR